MATYTLKRKTFGVLGAIGKFAVAHPITTTVAGVGAVGATAAGVSGVKGAKDIATGKMGEDNGGGY